MSKWSTSLRGLYREGRVPALDLDPPCATCQNWHPHQTVTDRGIYAGHLGAIRCCVAQTMFNDFSCYEDLPELKPR